MDYDTQDWIFKPNPDLPGTNAALLEGAKTLLQSLYSFTAGSKDYLPSSYTNFSLDATEYVVHAAHPTHVYWPVEGNQQLVWTSNPGGNAAEKGWSGTVELSQYQSPPLFDKARCKTDCSGFITSLFTYVNHKANVKTAFTNWAAGQQGQIPEAGCNTLDHSDALSYQNFFSNNSNGFSNIALADAQPGDILAWSNTGSKATDSGHVMLIVALADYPGAPSGGTTKLVVVADESSGHTEDTRTLNDPSTGKPYGGLGLGIVVLSTGDTATGPLQFYWTDANYSNTPNPIPQIGPVSIGRALTA